MRQAKRIGHGDKTLLPCYPYFRYNPVVFASHKRPTNLSQPNPTPKREAENTHINSMKAAWRPYSKHFCAFLCGFSLHFLNYFRQAHKFTVPVNFFRRNLTAMGGNAFTALKYFHLFFLLFFIRKTVSTI